jgi:hypothetical protein
VLATPRTLSQRKNTLIQLFPTRYDRDTVSELQQQSVQTGPKFAHVRPAEPSAFLMMLNQYHDVGPTVVWRVCMRFNL